MGVGSKSKVKKFGRKLSSKFVKRKNDSIVEKDGDCKDPATVIRNKTGERIIPLEKEVDNRKKDSSDQYKTQQPFQTIMAVTTVPGNTDFHTEHDTYEAPVFNTSVDIGINDPETCCGPKSLEKPYNGFTKSNQSLFPPDPNLSPLISASACSKSSNVNGIASSKQTRALISQTVAATESALTGRLLACLDIMMDEKLKSNSATGNREIISQSGNNTNLIRDQTSATTSSFGCFPNKGNAYELALNLELALEAENKFIGGMGTLSVDALQELKKSMKRCLKKVDERLMCVEKETMML